jgi:hypothetical protein
MLVLGVRRQHEASAREGTQARGHNNSALPLPCHYLAVALPLPLQLPCMQSSRPLEEEASGERMRLPSARGGVLSNGVRGLRVD